jgi:competence protein ComEC
MDAGQGRPRTLDIATVAALCAGVLAALWAPRLLPLDGVMPMLLVALAAGWRWRHRPATVRMAAFALGIALCTAHGHHALSQRLPATLDGTALVVDARVLGLPESGRDGARFLVEVERVHQRASSAGDVAEALAALEGRRLRVRWHGAGAALRPGEVWRWSLRLRALRPPTGPGQGDPGRRALLDGVAAEAVVQARSPVLRFSPARGIDALRDDLARRIAGDLGDGRGRFVAALAVGDTRGLDDVDWERLRQFGLTHLIAISGFHVGLVAGLGVLAVRLGWWCWPGLALRWRRPQAAAVAATAVAVGYAALAGFSLPTVRTVLMVAAVAAMHALRRRSPVAQPLLLAVALIAVVDPFALLTPGFWLSCGGVAWLIWCLPRVSSPWDGRAFLKAQWVATLGLLPIAAAFFLQVPIAGPLANLVAIPWISLVVVPLSLLGTLLLPLSDVAAGVAWAAAASAMDLLWGLLGAIPAALASSHWIPEPAPLAALAALLGIALLLLPRGLPWRFAGALLVLPLLFPRGVAPSEGGFEAIAFALPRGDAVLLRSRDAAVLVDAGPAGTGLVPALRALGIERLDLRIETRANAGRTGGIDAVDAAFKPSAVWRSAAVESAALRCEAGMQRRFDAFDIAALSPAPGFVGREPDAACVLRVRGPGLDLWLVSDAGRWVARRVARESKPAAPTQVWGAPAVVLDWQAALGADAALATRAPGPSLARRWPVGTPRVDLDGMQTLRIGAVDDAAAAAVPRPWRRDRARWWDGPPPRAAML